MIPGHEILRRIEREKVTVKGGVCLLVVAQTAFQDPDILDRVGVVDFVGVCLNAPGVVKVAIGPGDRCTIGQIIFRLALDRSTGSGIRVDLAPQRIPFRVAWVYVTNRSIGIRQVAIVSDDLEIQAPDQVLGQDLGNSHIVTLTLCMAEPRDLRNERGSVILADRIPRARPAQGQGGQVAEHVLTQREMSGVRDVIAFGAVDEGCGVSGLVMQVLDGPALLFALVLDDAGVAQDIDRCAAHLVDEIVGFHRKVFGDFLAHRGGLAGDVHAAAAVLAVENIGTVIGKHVGAGGAYQHQRRNGGDSNPMTRRRPHGCQLQPQPPPALPVAPREPSRASRMWSK